MWGTNFKRTYLQTGKWFICPDVVWILKEPILFDTAFPIASIWLLSFLQVSIFISLINTWRIPELSDIKYYANQAVSSALFISFILTWLGLTNTWTTSLINIPDDQKVELSPTECNVQMTKLWPHGERDISLFPILPPLK